MDLQLVGEPEMVRELRASDIRSLVEQPKGSKSPMITRISQRHHALARCLAEGLSNAEASIITGYSGSRVSILKDDPTFRELQKFYHDEKQQALQSWHEEAAGFGLDLLNELRERFDLDPEAFSNSFLSDLITKFADRTGNGPSSSQTQVNVNIGIADRLDAARKRAKAMID